MGKVITNIVIVLGFAAVAFAGYYFYAQKDTVMLDAGESTRMTQQMLVDTQKFIERRRQLEAIKLEMSLFEDRRFTTLRSYRTDVEEGPVGRSNPFADRGESQ